jgi:hypothetical protein
MNLIGFQLKPTDLSVAALFPEMPEGTEIHEIIYGEYTTNAYHDGQWEQPDEQLSIGEGAFLINPSAQDKTVTFVGEIAQGDLTNSIPAGLSIRCSVIPREGKVTAVLGLTLSPFDNIYVSTNNTLKVFTYLPGGNWHPFEPSLRVAESFIINASAPTNWITHFELTQPSKSDSFSRTPLAPRLDSRVPGVADNADAVTGTVNFANGAAQVNAPFVIAESGRGISGPDWKVELLLQTSSNFVSIAGPIGLEDGSLAGYFFAGSIPVAGMVAGESATFKVRVHNVLSQFSAESDPVYVTLGGGIVPPANLIGLNSLQVAEPASLSIARSGPKLTLSWPSWVSNMKLQVSDRLPPLWRTAMTTQTTNETFISTTIDPTTPSQFFRLISN